MAKNTEKSAFLFSNIPKVNGEQNIHATQIERKASKKQRDAITSSALVAQIQDNLAGKKAGKEKISGYVPVSLAAQFKATCKANKDKQSDVIEQLLRLYVGNDE